VQARLFAQEFLKCKFNEQKIRRYLREQIPQPKDGKEKIY